MDARELFTDAMVQNWGCGVRHGDWTRHYWQLEFVIAESNDCPYSDLEYWSEKEYRTCELCGKIHHTNEGGFVSFCQDATCIDLRKFFFLTGNKRPHLSLANQKTGSTRYQRVTWLRRKLAELYGNGKESYEMWSVYDVPIDYRIPMLLSMQIAREQIENIRTEGITDGAIDFVATKPEQRKQTEGCAADGNGGSVYQLN